jgi:hypothetical protein
MITSANNWIIRNPLCVDFPCSLTETHTSETTDNYTLNFFTREELVFNNQTESFTDNGYNPSVHFINVLAENKYPECSEELSYYPNEKEIKENYNYYLDNFKSGIDYMDTISYYFDNFLIY